VKQPWWAYGLWILAAGAVGLLVSSLFSSVLHVPRNGFLVPYTVIVGAFLDGYRRWSKVDISQYMRHHWGWGFIGAVMVSMVMVVGVLQQPASPRPHGVELLFALVWAGVIYGTLDALLLTVMPVLAIQHMWEQLGIRQHWWGRLASAVAALAASLFVTAAYHWGYAEFRGPGVVQPLIGNALITLGYLLTMHPVTPVVAHVAMHIAAVMHGMESTVQLPPHY
jgi:hypothetical protein